jgi:amino acid transporter
VRGTVSIQVWLVAASAALVAICLIATILILESGARLSLMGDIASGPVPYVFSLAAVALLVVSLLQRRNRALFRNPRRLFSLAVGVAVVIVVVVAVNAISPYQDCGPGGNLISIGSGHGVESRNGIQSITEQQYRSYLACSGVHSWLQAFAAAGVALIAQIVGLVTRS